jgi:hypothetical protein
MANPRSRATDHRPQATGHGSQTAKKHTRVGWACASSRPPSNISLFCFFLLILAFKVQGTDKHLSSTACFTYIRSLVVTMAVHIFTRSTHVLPYSRLCSDSASKDRAIIQGRVNGRVGFPRSHWPACQRRDEYRTVDTVQYIAINLYLENPASVSSPSAAPTVEDSM